MQLSSEIVDTPPRMAATVILLRQAQAGLEVFLLQRHRASDVLGGLYVFPGGKVDPADATPATHALLDQPVDALHQALHEPDISPATAASLYVAALREAFEECGVLLAHTAQGQPVDPAEVVARLRDGQPFGAALAQLGVQLHTRALLPWSRWITPRMPSLEHEQTVRHPLFCGGGARQPNCAARQLRGHRQRLAHAPRRAGAGLRDGQPFGAALAQLGVQLHTRALLPWSRWITPRMPSLGMSKRFDTRFFVAAVPANQIALHDNFEATASVWLTPRAALAQYWAGQVELAPPQIMTLAHLAPHADVASVFAARHRAPPSV